MRTKLILSNKPERYIHNVRNMDTTPQGATISVGSPLVLNLSAIPQPPVYTNGLQAGWEDGLQVVLPASAGAANTGMFFYGFSVEPIIAQQLGETLVHGVGQAAVFVQSRANSTAPWVSGASSAGFGLGLSVDTINNCFQTGTATTPPAAYLVGNISSYASSASNPADTRLVLTQLCRAFVRLM